MSLLWFFLPDEALPLIIVGVGLALILGFGRGVLGILGLLLLIPIVAPFVEALLGELPLWVSLLILAIVGLAIFRGLAGLLIGARAADHMMGILAADVVRLVVLFLFFPFRLAGWVFRAISNGRV